MKRYYKDILELSNWPPKWFDENGVPRFCEFSPDRCAGFYADEVVLMVIQCQSCKHEFKVCLSADAMERVRTEGLADAVRSNEIDYGDPPNMQCCAAGPSMNSIPIRVLEFWYLDGKWERDSSLEREIKRRRCCSSGRKE